MSTRARAGHVLDNWREHSDGRVLASCFTNAHADFMAASSAETGIRAVAVHTGATAAPRRGPIEWLHDGELDVVFSVDLFNEGLGATSIDTVVMLRQRSRRWCYFSSSAAGCGTMMGDRDRWC